MEWSKQSAEQLTDAARHMPSKLLELTTTGQPGGRDSGLLVTRSDIFKIKRYERLGLSLPISTAQIEVMLGLGRTDINGLEQEDILELYRLIHVHAASWTDTEQRLKLVNTKLGSFASDFLSTGDRLIKHVDSMDWLDPFDTSIRDLKLEDVKGLGFAALSPGDLKKKNNLQIMLHRVRRSIKEQQSVIEEVRDKLARFANTLSHDLIPKVNAKIELARRNGLADSVKALDEDIIRLADKIKVKREEYDQLVNTMLMGLILGLVGFYTMINIFGEDAERVRQERNALIEERDSKMAETKRKAPLIQVVGSLLGYLEHIELSMSDALAGTQNLQSLWEMLLTWVDISLKKLVEIKDRSSMAEFAMGFEEVLKHWKPIEEQSQMLAVIFNRAINDWNSGVKV